MSEKAEVKRSGSKATKNSGRGKTDKGDAKLDIFTIDFKEYEKSFSISKDVWAKICYDAYTNNYSEPALKIILGSGDTRTRLWIVAEHIIEDYVRLRKEEEERGD